MRRGDQWSPRRTLFLVASAAVAGLAVPATLAFACTGAQWITLSPNAGPPGTSVILTGHLFQSGASPVTVRWLGMSGPVLWSGPPATDGTIRFSFVVPSAPPGYDYINSYQYDAQGQPEPGSPAHTSFQVTPPPLSSSQSGTQTSAPVSDGGRATSSDNGTQGANGAAAPQEAVVPAPLAVGVAVPPVVGQVGSQSGASTHARAIPPMSRGSAGGPPSVAPRSTSLPLAVVLSLAVSVLVLGVVLGAAALCRLRRPSNDGPTPLVDASESAAWLDAWAEVVSKTARDRRVGEVELRVPIAHQVEQEAEATTSR